MSKMSEHLRTRAARARRLAAMYEDIDPEVAVQCLDAARQIDELAWAEEHPAECAHCNDAACTCKAHEEIPF